MGFGVFGGDGHGGGYFVAVFEVEELDAGGAAAGAADGFGVDTDDFAELADKHHFGGVVDELDAGDFASLGAGLHVDDAGAAAGLETVAVDVGALAETVLRDGEDEAGREAELFVELVELGLGGGIDFERVGAEDLLAVGGSYALGDGVDGGHLGLGGFCRPHPFR